MSFDMMTFFISQGNETFLLYQLLLIKLVKIVKISKKMTLFNDTII